MTFTLTPGPRDEKMISLVRETVEKCQHEEGTATFYDAHQGRWSIYPHELGTCHGCDRSLDCTLMNLCHEYGYDKIFDAVFYAFKGTEKTLHDIEEYEWENITEDYCFQFLELLSNKAVLD